MSGCETLVVGLVEAGATSNEKIHYSYPPVHGAYVQRCVPLVATCVHLDAPIDLCVYVCVWVHQKERECIRERERVGRRECGRGSGTKRERGCLCVC